MGYFLILPTHIFTHRYLRLSSLLCCFNTQLFQQPVTIKKPSQILSRKKVFLHKCLKKKYIRYHTNQHKHHRYYSRWYGVVICVFLHVLFLLAENEYEKNQVFFGWPNSRTEACLQTTFPHEISDYISLFPVILLFFAFPLFAPKTLLRSISFHFTHATLK